MTKLIGSQIILLRSLFGDTTSPASISVVTTRCVEEIGSRHESAKSDKPPSLRGYCWPPKQENSVNRRMSGVETGGPSGGFAGRRLGDLGFMRHGCRQKKEARHG